VHRTFRLRGQLLVLAAALLGAVIGVALGLVGEGGGTTAAVAAPARGSRVAPATAPPSSRPPAPRAAGSGQQADSGDSPDEQRAEPVARPGKGHDKPPKDERDRDKPGKDKDKPGKGK
jgi:hypothetical protein